MEKPDHGPDAAREAVEQGDRRASAEPVRRTFAEPATTDTRMTAQPTLASDGQLVEVGYGHGV